MIEISRPIDYPLLVVGGSYDDNTSGAVKWNDQKWGRRQFTDTCRATGAYVYKEVLYGR